MEENRCLNCQWCYSDFTCTCPSSDYASTDTSMQDCSDCGQYYNELELLVKEDDKTERIDFD